MDCWRSACWQLKKVILLSLHLYLLIFGVSATGNERVTAAKQVVETGAVSPRIIGGYEPEEEYPWLAALYNPNKNSNPIFQHFCGGSLVAEDFILTAAHCVEGESVLDVKAQIGRKALNGYALANETYFETRTVEEIFIHPGYQVSGGNDIALIKLNGKSTLEPIMMNDGSVTLDNGEELKTMGWGSVSGVEGSKSPLLLQIEVAYVDVQTCQSSYDYAETILCTINIGEVAGGPCYGDSGGPILPTDGNNVLLGVTSFSQGNCGGFTGFTRVSYHYEWIASELCKRSSNFTTDCAPTISPSPSLLCWDNPDWSDGLGYGCDWYEQSIPGDDFLGSYYDDGDTLCALFGNSAPGTDGLVASSACCVCGGGNAGVPPFSSPSSSPTRSAQPSAMPLPMPSIAPSITFSDKPSSAPIQVPSNVPSTSSIPSKFATTNPSSEPSSHAPSTQPTSSPSVQPIMSPSMNPTFTPSVATSRSPTNQPSALSTSLPSDAPTEIPTYFPAAKPISSPSVLPIVVPSDAPSEGPTTAPILSDRQNNSQNTPSDAPVAVSIAIPQKAWVSKLMTLGIWACGMFLL